MSYDLNTKNWLLILNKYQRDNLLWLLNACGYPNMKHTVEPFNLANTGDWLGEIAIMLSSPTGKIEICEDDRPNTNHDDLRRNIEWAGWRKQ